MKALFFLGIFLLATVAAKAQDVYVCKNANVSFFSSAPIEDIEAQTDKAVSALDLKAKTIYFKVIIRSFEFQKNLMQEHFNEDFMESDRFPEASFNGKILSDSDLTKDGTYPVTVSGQLTIHGVTKDYTTPGTLIVQDNSVKANSTFKVKLADHKVKIPKIVIMNIAEVVDVKVSATYTPKQG